MRYDCQSNLKRKTLTWLMRDSYEGVEFKLKFEGYF